MILKGYEIANTPTTFETNNLFLSRSSVWGSALVRRLNDEIDIQTRTRRMSRIGRA
jgi:hypothetical protein